jgi:predicted nucleotidyltransferase
LDDIPHAIRGADRRWLEQLRTRLQSDDRVAALFLGGSHAAGAADEYSDLDLYLITTDEAYESLRSERQALMHSLGEIVFLEEHSDFGFLMLLFMYADGVHGEMALAPARDLHEVHGGPHIALLDREGLLGGRVFEIHRLDEATRAGIARRQLTWFWYDRSLLDVALERGGLWTAHHHLELCRERCLDLALLRAHPEVWPGGHEKAERMLDAPTLAQFEPTVVMLDADQMRGAARRITQLYLQLGPEIARLCGISFPDRLVETQTRRSTA